MQLWLSDEIWEGLPKFKVFSQRMIYYLIFSLFLWVVFSNRTADECPARLPEVVSSPSIEV